ncbi:hypothetical protein ACFPIJ_15950 [Dactylosporangium cerinum]|uniref:Uncharacterized protein n=1 Tax=Dactylosporangium cerinum TaxID=1434730 RepID=A0ABV9VTA7_9ACTN
MEIALTIAIVSMTGIDPVPLSRSGAQPCAKREVDLAAASTAIHESGYPTTTRLIRSGSVRRPLSGDILR